MSELLLDRAGRRRSPATMPGFHLGHAPGNKGLRYPADPPKVEEIVAVMRTAGDGAHGRRLRGLIVIMWRAGLRIQEALGLTEGDLDHRRGAVLVRRGKGGRRREVGMDAWAWEQLLPWLELRREPPGRAAAVRHQRHDARPPLVASRGPRRAAAHRRRCRGPAPLRAAPTPPRSRRREGARRSAADRHPTPARPQQPRHHVRVPTGHRQRRDHRDRPRPTRTDDPRQRLAPALTYSGGAANRAKHNCAEGRGRGRFGALLPRGRARCQARRDGPRGRARRQRGGAACARASGSRTSRRIDRARAQALGQRRIAPAPPHRRDQSSSSSHESPSPPMTTRPRAI